MCVFHCCSATPLYTVNDPYSDRPLPHVIMSPAFFADPYVGLRPPSPLQEDVDDASSAPADDEANSSATDEDISNTNLFDRKFETTSSKVIVSICCLLYIFCMPILCQ